MDATVYSLLINAAEQWPDRPAVFDQYGMLSFKQLHTETEILRTRLLALGIGAGNCVGVKAQNGRHFIMGIFAVVGCGAAVLPLAHQLKKAEIDEILEETHLHAILDDLSGTPPFDLNDAMITTDTASFRFTFTGISLQEAFAPHISNPAFVRFTSGTTGKSKGVIISHQAAIERVEAANKSLDLGCEDTVVWVLPMAYHFVVSIVLYVRFGSAIAIVKDFLAKNIIAITNKYKGTMLYASPVQIRLLANDTGNEMMPTLKKVISTSAAISMEVCETFKNRFHQNVSQAYGIIEVGLPMMNLEKSAEHPDAVGYVVPGYTVAVLDDDFNPLPSGHIGHLGIKGPGMFAGYLNPPVLRDAILKNGYFLTADFATITTDGLIKIEGRSKSVINISGIKVFPEEIEIFLETIPGIKQARISSSPHPLLGQIIEGEIIVEEGKTIDVEEVLTYCRKRLSSFKAPQRIKIVDSLPMTGSGKLQRH